MLLFKIEGSTEEGLCKIFYSQSTSGFWCVSCGQIAPHCPILLQVCGVTVVLSKLPQGMLMFAM